MIGVGREVARVLVRRFGAAADAVPVRALRDRRPPPGLELALPLVMKGRPRYASTLCDGSRLANVDGFVLKEIQASGKPGLRGRLDDQGDDDRNATVVTSSSPI